MGGQSKRILQFTFQLMISIIIPVYNQPKKLEETLNSLFEQTVKDLEIIIVDDASTEDVSKVIDDFKNSPKVKELNWPVITYKLEKNSGAPIARNKGFDLSTGEYLFFCDADAILRPQALEKLIQALDANQEASYVYSSFLWGKKLFRLGRFSQEKLKQAPCIHTMALIRRQDFPPQKWDESITKLQDWDLWLTMLENGKTGIWLDEVLFQVHPGGTMSSWIPSFFYRLFPFLPQVKRYKKALEIVKKKHKLL